MKDTEISAVLTPVLDSFGLELEAVDVVPAGKRKLLRIVVDGDGPNGRGPRLDDIAEASRAVSDALDATDATGASPYTLEVSSRGVSRPLTLPRHWRRNAGRLVTVRLVDGDPVTGRIAAADETSLGLDVEGTETRLAWAEIRDGRIQIEFNRPAASAEVTEEEE